MIRAFLGFSAVAWVYDVCVRPASAAKAARGYCDAVGKPMLSVGCGMPNSSFRVFVLGPVLPGDVNLDLVGPKNRPCERIVPEPGSLPCRGDAMTIPFPDKHFGALLASHVLEHVENPAAAMREWHRVADRVYVVVPVWWAPHTWMQIGHKWYIPADLSEARPLWGPAGRKTMRLRNSP